MKELFLNGRGKNTAKVSLVVDNCDMLLYYHLNDNPVQHNWQENFTANVSSGIDLTPVTAGSAEDWAIKLTSLVKQTNSKWAVSGIPTQEDLNALHTEFVEYMTAGEFSDGLVTTWFNINTIIHTLEPKLNNPLDVFNSTVRFNIGAGTLNRTPIEEYHKLWIDSDHRQWGSLVLGYDTLGKDWSDIWYNNDVDILADPKQVQVQNHIGLETWLAFDLESPWKKFAENKFYNWYQTLTEEQQALVPINNLNKVALGRYILGKLIITDELLKFNSNVSDWYVLNHRCKLEWNRDIMSKVTAVKGVEFFDSDMYYNSLISHTDTGKLFNA